MPLDLPMYRLATLGLSLIMFLMMQTSTPSEEESALRGSQIQEPPRYWCMLTEDLIPKHNKWFSTIGHFPHSLEWYSDCWGWVQEKSGGAGAEARGGFIIDKHVEKKLHKKYWNRAFFPAMQWPVQVLGKNETNSLDYERITTKYYPGSGWFQKDDVCDDFRQRLWRNLEVVPRETSSRQGYERIGILNRNESRAIADIDELVKKLQSHYPTATIDVRAFDSEYELKSEKDTLAVQAQWFADQDLIILAHGAAMSNVVFMRPETTVLELFPRYYFNDMFWDLMKQCNVQHQWYYDGIATKKNAYTQELAKSETEAEWKNRMTNKKRDIHFKWKDVDHIIDNLLRHVKENHRKLS